MLILLPPSETKTPRTSGHPTDLGGLSFPSLTAARRSVLTALAQVSARPDAHEVLGVPASLAAEAAAHNTGVLDSPATPVAGLYTGVLYDALDLATLSGAARRRANAWLVVVSAAYGALRPTDRVGAYRLAMDVDLPGVGRLGAWWRDRLADELSLAAGQGLIVDCRSTTYVPAWQPTGAQARRWVRIVVPGASHHAKHTRGLLARHLCLHGCAARTPMALADELATAFHVRLDAPVRPGRPWQLGVTAPVH
ncbi:YaaA family protein [Raineyella fluvialis]|uniref:Peroxide stress protein YaaA n=1 Tax=Raineyella fluvialis TaxID=2662261 RepID=A0A5Q2F6V5_9ACTN|nr:peroxide stress protein YaaA [Raineyella fluvialis]QGF22720.1 peroxide stress protein YaaA [Raineyella fluvialis]